MLSPLFCLAVATLASANIYTTFPDASDVLKAEQTYHLTWKNTPDPPFSSAFRSTRVDLCLGTDAHQLCLFHLGTIEPQRQHSLDFHVPAKIGTSGAYFVRYESKTAKDDCGEPLAAWSAAFNVTGLTGKAPEGVGAHITSNSTNSAFTIPSALSSPVVNINDIYASASTSAFAPTQTVDSGLPTTSTTVISMPASTTLVVGGAASYRSCGTSLGIALIALAWIAL